MRKTSIQAEGTLAVLNIDPEPTSSTVIPRSSLREFTSPILSVASITDFSETPTASTLERKEVVATQNEEEQLVDHRDPKVNPFMMFSIIGWEIVPLFLGALAAAGLGVIPLVFYWVLGNLIGDLSTSSAGSVRYELFL
jgi:hypothetical protein